MPAHDLHRDRAALERTRDLIDSKTRDSLVAGYEALIPSLESPDPNDRQVLAAAIVGRRDVIVTQNLNHFPEPALRPTASMSNPRTNFFATTLIWTRAFSVASCRRFAGDLRTHLIRLINISTP